MEIQCNEKELDLILFTLGVTGNHEKDIYKRLEIIKEDQDFINDRE